MRGSPIARGLGFGSVMVSVAALSLPRLTQFCLANSTGRLCRPRIGRELEPPTPAVIPDVCCGLPSGRRPNDQPEKVVFPWVLSRSF